MAVNVFKDEFVPNIQGAPYHSKWVGANKTEAAKWASYRDKVIAYRKGDPPVSAPAMATKYGRALVAAGKEHMSVTDIGSPPVEPPVTPPGPVTWEGPIIFNDASVPSGGLTVTNRYFETTSTTPAVQILTARPITFRNCGFRNITGPGTGYIFDAYHGTPSGADITIDNCLIYGAPAAGGSSYTNSARWLVATNFKSLIITNCTIEYTRGIELWEGTYPNATCQILRNRHRNIFGHCPPGDFTYVSNFIQMRVMRNTTFEIGWNEIVNEYDKSEAEDLISIYKSQNVHIYDNMFFHQSSLGNQSGASTSGITGDASDGPSVDNCLIERNQLVDAMGIFLSLQNGGVNNNVRNNRIIADQLLPNGQQKANGTSGLDISTTGGSNNHFTGNLVGYMSAGGGRNDGNITNSVEGWAANTHLDHNPTNADELAEWTFWQNKVAAAGVTIGAGQVTTPPPSSTLLNDDFTTFNTSLWQTRFNYQNDSYGAGSTEQQAYRAANVTVSGGNLNLTAKVEATVDSSGTPRAYTSGMIQSNGQSNGSVPPGFGFTYGLLEARIKLPPGGTGFFPALWLCNSDYNAFCNEEIDILEWISSEPNSAKYNYHYRGNHLVGTEYVHSANLSSDFHVYGLEWRAGVLRWLFDGQEKMRYDNASFVTSVPHYIICNFAVGGAGTWGGAPNTSTVFPATMLVDYIRVTP